MTMRTVRTYKLRLSDEGTALFLRCHNRLAHLTGAFIPYGATLAVAVTLLERARPSSIVALLRMPRCPTLAGNALHFVGASAMLAETIAQIQDGLAANMTANPATAAKLQLAGLLILEKASDEALLDAYRSAGARYMFRGTAHIRRSGAAPPE